MNTIAATARVPWLPSQLRPRRGMAKMVRTMEAIGFASSAQPLQPRADLAHGNIGLLQQLAHGEEAVELSGVVPGGDADAGLLQACGIFVAFVAQGIGAGGQHISRR